MQIRNTAAHNPALQLGFCFSRLILLVLFAASFLIPGAAFAEQRFPPPEFESGYKIPVTTTPQPRPLPMQYVDVLVLAAALAISTYLIHKKRSRKGLVALSIFSLAYFGFYRKGCVCAIGSIQNVALALGHNSYVLPMAVLAFFVLPLLVALFAGRAFCAGACPHGALQELLLVKPVKIPPWLEHGLGIIPFVYLGAGVLFAATGTTFLICRYDPFIPLFRMGGSFLMLGIGAAFVLASLFIGRPYCRFLCPYGALLKLAGAVSKWRIMVSPDSCTKCRLCERACPHGAMRMPEKEVTDPQLLAADRRRLVQMVVLMPLLIVALGWLGTRMSIAASRLHPTVELAERLFVGKPATVQPGSQNANELSLLRAQQTPNEIVPAALDIRKRFALAGCLFGAWVGLVIGGKLISLGVRRTRPGYEPDSGACVGCARCFTCCPNNKPKRTSIAAAQPLQPGTNATEATS